MSIEECIDLEAACERLTEKQRQALYLVCYLSYTQEEAAAILGICRTAVTERMKRARCRIEDALAA